MQLLIRDSNHFGGTVSRIEPSGGVVKPADDLVGRRQPGPKGALRAMAMQRTLAPHGALVAGDPDQPTMPGSAMSDSVRSAVDTIRSRRRWRSALLPLLLGSCMQVAHWEGDASGVTCALSDQELVVLVVRQDGIKFELFFFEHRETFTPKQSRVFLLRYRFGAAPAGSVVPFTIEEILANETETLYDIFDDEDVLTDKMLRVRPDLDAITLGRVGRLGVEPINPRAWPAADRPWLAAVRFPAPILDLHETSIHRSEVAGRPAYLALDSSARQAVVYRRGDAKPAVLDCRKLRPLTRLSASTAWAPQRHSLVMLESGRGERDLSFVPTRMTIWNYDSGETVAYRLQRPRTSDFR